MGQIEVYDWFKNLEVKDEYFSIKEITRLMNKSGLVTQTFSVWRSVIKLKEAGYLIMKECSLKEPIKYRLNTDIQFKGSHNHNKRFA